MVKLIESKNDLRLMRKSILRTESVGFVPTMGNLHNGHLSLVQKSIEATDITFISIFVNPTQFGVNEDYSNYPRTLKEDILKIETLSSKKEIIVFAPSDISEVYPRKFTTKFSIPHLENCLCGIHRPGHFSGVLDVIYQLFNIIEPNTAFFGQKDYQQLCLIRNFANDLFPQISVEGLPIVREENGLAMSSRNKYLKEDEIKDSLSLYKTLRKVKNSISNKDSYNLENFKINSKSVSWDCLEVLDSKNLKPISDNTNEFLIAGALKINNKVRLIDNILWSDNV